MTLPQLKALYTSRGSRKPFLEDQWRFGRAVKEYLEEPGRTAEALMEDLHPGEKRDASTLRQIQKFGECAKALMKQLVAAGVSWRKVQRALGKKGAARQKALSLLIKGRVKDLEGLVDRLGGAKHRRLPRALQLGGRLKRVRADIEKAAGRVQLIAAEAAASSQNQRVWAGQRREGNKLLTAIDEAQESLTAAKAAIKRVVPSPATTRRG